MEQSNAFTFRALTLADRAAVEAISAKIWEGDDYLPSVYGDWVLDAEGRFNACLLDGTLVGFAKLSFVGPGHAWLEGLRKDPDAKVKGVGSALCRHALGQLKAMGNIQSIRFSTYFKNAESISLNERIGFRKVASFSLKSRKFSASDDRQQPKDGLAVTVGPCEQSLVTLNRMRAAGWFGSFLCLSWKAYPCTEGLLPEGVAAHGLHLEARNRLGSLCGSAWVSMDPSKKQGNVLGFEADDEDAARALLAEAERACLKQGYDYLEAFVPPNGKLLKLFDACLYESWEEENDFLVYELPVERLADF